MCKCKSRVLVSQTISLIIKSVDDKSELMKERIKLEKANKNGDMVPVTKESQQKRKNQNDTVGKKKKKKPETDDQAEMQERKTERQKKKRTRERKRKRSREEKTLYWKPRKPKQQRDGPQPPWTLPTSHLNHFVELQIQHQLHMHQFS